MIKVTREALYFCHTAHHTTAETCLVTYRLPEVGQSAEIVTPSRDACESTDARCAETDSVT